MPKRTGNLTQVRIIKLINRRLKPGMVTWLDKDQAARLIDNGCAVVYLPTIHDMETR